MFTRQIVQLRLIISRLQNAYNGEDVGWIDTGVEYSCVCLCGVVIS